MENKRKSNVKVLILLLLLTAVLLISSTYAWFTSNQTVSVSNLQVNVAATNGLQLSVDGTNWKSVIQSTDITSAHTTYGTSVNQLPTSMEAVSTAGNVDVDGLLEMYYGQVATDRGDYIITATKDEETEGTSGRFIAFDLFFKVDAQTPVYLTPLSTVTSTAATGIANAARVAFLVEGNTTAGDTVANIQGLWGATTGSTYIWEPNFDIHTAAGVANARDVYTVTTSTAGAARIAYDGIKAPITYDPDARVDAGDPDSANPTAVRLGSANRTAFPNLFGQTNITHPTATGFTTNTSLFTLSAGITKVRVYMWIEGQDVDCENNASGTDAIFNLDITSVAPVVGP